MAERLIEVDAYVLPTLGDYTAWVDVDADEYAQKYGKEPSFIKILVYSPQPLSEGELAEISDALNTKWQLYIFEREREYPGIRTKWARIMGGTDMTMIGSEVAMEMAYGLGAIATFMVSIVFWGFIIFAFAIGGFFRSIFNLKRRRLTKRLLENWRGSIAIEGKERSKFTLLKDIHNYYSQLDGREVEIYEKMRDFCKMREYPPYKFYKKMVARFKAEGETPVLQRQTPYFKKRLRNLFLGLKVEPPVIVAPMRVMAWREDEA